MLIELAGVRVDVRGDLGLQRRSEHPPRPVPHDLIDQRPADRGGLARPLRHGSRRRIRGRWRRLALGDYGEHGRTFPTRVGARACLIPSLGLLGKVRLPKPIHRFQALLQVREQLALRRYPLYVAEGASAGKLGRINGSAYLSRGLRSLSSCGGGLLVYGHSLDPNDDHVFEAVARSKIIRIAVSLYGDPDSDVNLSIQRRVADVGARRTLRGGRSLEYRFFDASSVPLWHIP
jgi:hypothetical protein